MNKMEIKFTALTENIIFVRASVVAFLLKLDLEMAILNEIKIVVSEAVTNAIIHGYESNSSNEVIVKGKINDKRIELEVIDNGVGIKDINKARTPMFSTKKNDERSGLGFTIMEAFTDELVVESKVDIGTTVKCLIKI